MIPTLHTALFCFASLTSISLRAADDLLIADFEIGDHGTWTSTGDAFGKGPASGALPDQMAVAEFSGKGFINSFHGGDASLGTLTSPEFRIERRYLGFLIGGGGFAGKTCMELLIDGKPVRSATGTNIHPGGSENLQPGQWDVADLRGKTAVIRITDNATGGWGHITVDHITQTDQRMPAIVENMERQFRVSKRYLNIPIKNGAPKREVTTLVDGKVVVKNTMELAESDPDWWTFMDVSEWNGKAVTFRVDKLREDSSALKMIEQGDDLKGAENLYQEPLRGQFHFSARRGWLNDPNGMVFHDGIYHLFFQHNPYGWAWGNMHWGHAISRDMVHWKELPETLAPDEMGPMFSGGAVVDWKNSSGFGKPGKPPLVLFYTAAGDPTVQGLAYSTDGVKFTKYSGNPILKQVTPGNRDPKVIWHEPTKKWVMTLYVEIDRIHTIYFYNSDDLKNWTYLSRVDHLFECPEFYELPIDGDPAKSKWVITAASGEYLIGSFDGKVFKAESPKLPGFYGNVCYAAQTFSDMPKEDGRRVQIGWLRTDTPGMPFNQSMSIPRELKLVSTPDGPRQTLTPVKELESLRAKSHKIEAGSLDPGAKNPLEGIKAELVELRAEIEPGAAEEIIFKLRGASVIYRKANSEIEVNGLKAPAPLKDGRLLLTAYLDRHALEVFASGGLTYAPVSFHPKPGDLTLGLESKGGAARIHSLEVHELKSAWNAR